MKTRNCAKCDKEFQTTAKVGSNYSYCKTCLSLKSKKYWAENKARIAEINRKSFIKGKYGITEDILKKMSDEQNNQCAICKQKEPQAVDHDHITGKTRGLLCRACNTALGMFKDNIEVLSNAISYLDRYKK